MLSQENFELCIPVNQFWCTSLLIRVHVSKRHHVEAYKSYEKETSLCNNHDKKGRGVLPFFIRTRGAEAPQPHWFLRQVADIQATSIYNINVTIFMLLYNIPTLL